MRNVSRTGVVAPVCIRFLSCFLFTFVPYRRCSPESPSPEKLECQPAGRSCIIFFLQQTYVNTRYFLTSRLELCLRVTSDWADRNPTVSGRWNEGVAVGRQSAVSLPGKCANWAESPICPSIILTIFGNLRLWVIAIVNV